MSTPERPWTPSFEPTATAFAGGWFHSGDIGVMHPDGYIEVGDRKKDIIVSGGENISMIEVEHTIVRHPAVLECAVVAIPDPRAGPRFLRARSALTGPRRTWPRGSCSSRNASGSSSRASTWSATRRGARDSNRLSELRRDSPDTCTVRSDEI